MEMYRFKGRKLDTSCLILIFFLYSFLGSCISPKKFLYFNDIAQDTMGATPIVINHVTPFVDPKIEPNDILAITVQTLAQNEGNSPMASNSTAGRDPFSGFLVDKDGYVEVTLIGMVKVAGLTTREAKEVIRQKAKMYYNEPVINVRIINFDVMVLGDIGRTGMVNITNEKATVVDVIGMSGDLLGTSKRKNIMLIRSEGDQKKFIRFDMTQSSIFQSPYLYVKQRDILYIEPSNFKVQSSDNSFLRYFGIGTSLVSVVSLLVAFKIIK